MGAVGQVGVAFGVVQGAKAPPSSLHSKLELGLGGAEGEARVVVGGGRALGGAGVDRRLGRRAVSIVQVRVAGLGSVLLAVSVARTAKV